MNHGVTKYHEENKIQLEAGIDYGVLAILFSDASAHQAVVYYANRNGRLLFDRFDLRSGKKLSRTYLGSGNYLTKPHILSNNPLQLGYDNAYLTLSPDGSRVAMVNFSGDIGICSLEEGNQIFDIFYPVGASSKDPSNSVVYENEAVYCAFLDSNRLLVVHGNGARSLWQVPKGEEVYCSFPPGAGLQKEKPLDQAQVFVEMLDGTHRRPPLVQKTKFLPCTLALSPDRTMVALFNGDGYDIFDTAGGKFLRKTASVGHQTRYSEGKGNQELMGIIGTAFSPDGKHLGSYYALGKFKQMVNRRDLPGVQVTFTQLAGKFNQYAVIWWDTQTGAEVGRIRLSNVGGNNRGLTWWGPKHLLLWDNSMAIVDLNRGEVTGNIRPDRQRIGFRLPGEPLLPYWPDPLRGQVWLDARKVESHFLTRLEYPN